MSRLTNKVAIITGASKGIGAGIAKAYAAEGASVVVNYSSDKQGADRVVEEISSNGGKAVAIHASVAVAEDVKRLFSETKNAFGKVDILVNNAGVFKFDALESITEDEFHRQFNINVLGTILATQQAVQSFDENSGGSIINVSSMITGNPMAYSTVYSATKGAVDILAVALSKELGSRNIRINTLSPGATETEGTHAAGIAGSDQEKQMIAQTPLGRLGQPGDIASVAVFLASDDAKWITGERIGVSGGLK